MTLLPHQQRVIDESAALSEKLVALIAFIATNPVFNDLPEMERVRLHLQFRAMQEYSNILTERIAAF